MTALIAAAAFVLAATITAIAHAKVPPDWWGHRIGRTRWRRANLPAGGVGLGLLAAVFPAAAGVLVPAALAMSAVAVAGRFIDPLPRA